MQSSYNNYYMHWLLGWLTRWMSLRRPIITGLTMRHTLEWLLHYRELTKQSIYRHWITPQSSPGLVHTKNNTHTGMHMHTQCIVIKGIRADQRDIRKQKSLQSPLQNVAQFTVRDTAAGCTGCPSNRCGYLWQRWHQTDSKPCTHLCNHLCNWNHSLLPMCIGVTQHVQFEHLASTAT